MIDALIPEFDKALRAVFASAPTRRPMPGSDLPEAELSDDEKRHVAALMRVNHCGEICAQALYQGQALSSRDPVVKRELEQAAWEETEHLNWTETASPNWAGARACSIPCGMPVRWPSACLPENAATPGAWASWPKPSVRWKDTCESHKLSLPAQDRKSWEVLEQMKTDEMRHAGNGDPLRSAGFAATGQAGDELSSK
jgi:ubiquinone biosynthesis monooxygenase Coq7